MQKIFQVDLDIKNPQLKSVPPIEVVSGDTDTNIFNINLLENFKEVNASGNTAVITFVKSDGTTVFQNLTAVNASKGQYTCTLSSQTIVVPGRVKAEVSLYEGTKRLTSVRFEFNVRKALLDEGTAESSNEFSALTQALSEVTDLKDLAGEGRTTETVKGNADAIAAHSADDVTKADVIQTTEINNSSKIPSSVVTYNLQQLINVINNKAIFKTTNVTDLNNTLDTGFYQWGENAVNKPFNYGIGLTITYMAGFKIQLAVKYAGTPLTMAYRSQNQNTWSSWYELTGIAI